MKWIRIFDNLNTAISVIPHTASKLVIIGDQRICLSNINSQFYAIKDACPHSGQSLSQGKINYLNEIVCPLHGYRFSLKHGQEGDHKCKDAQTYRVKVADDGVFIFV